MDKGDKCVIVGKSGCGKSTLLNIIGGLQDATAGSVLVGGSDVAAMSEAKRTAYRQKFLGLVFQFHYLLKDFTAALSTSRSLSSRTSRPGTWTRRTQS